MELLVLEPAGPRPTLPHADHARRVMAAAAAVAGDAPRPGAGRRRPDRDVDRLAGRRRDREAAGRRRTSTAARWAPGRPRRRSRTCSSRRTATASSCRTSAARLAMDAPGSARSSATGAASMPRTSSPRSITSWSWGWPIRTGSASLGLSYGGFMVNWLVGAAPGRLRGRRQRERRVQPGERLGQLRLRAGIRPDGAAGRPVQRRRTRGGCGASRRSGTSPASGPRCSCSRARRTCAARPRTTSSCSSRCGTSAGRWSTCSTRRAGTPSRSRAGSTGGSTATSGCSPGSIGTWAGRPGRCTHAGPGPGAET